MIGTKLFDYEIIRKIKAGGMGVVYEGRRIWGRQERVAIKFLLENLRDDERIRQRFIREAEILETLHHPAIVHILGLDPERDAFIMEFVEGPTLSELLQQTPQHFHDPEKAVSFFSQVLDAFDYAHDKVIEMGSRIERGVVHRDIKPGNIMVQPGGTPKILDFGISRIATFESTLTDPKLQMGSIAYMSPEQVVNPTGVDWRSDIYSLGVNLWELFVAKSPYPKVTTYERVVEVQQRICREPLSPLADMLPNLSPAMRAFATRIDPIIAKATAKDPNQRYQRCRDMRDDLQAALTAKPPAEHDTVIVSSKKPTAATPVPPTPAPSLPPVTPKMPADRPAAMRPVNVIGVARPKASGAKRNVWLVAGAIIGVCLLALVGFWTLSSTTKATADNSVKPKTTSAAILKARADSCYQIGQTHFFGRNGVPQNFQKAAIWYRKAADLGSASGQNDLGWLYQRGFGVTQNDAEAVKWYKKAAEQGDADGENSLGFMYEHGLAVEKNYLQAAHWYRKAAEQGNAIGQNNLGALYDLGLGVQEDKVIAASWYRKAADQHNKEAQFNLGTLYEFGQGVEQDLNKAIQWYRVAAQKGNRDAQKALRRLQVSR